MRGRGLRAGVLLLLLTTMTVACGGGDGDPPVVLGTDTTSAPESTSIAPTVPPTAGPQPRESSTTTPLQPTTTSSPGTESESPLKRKEIPPASVATQFSGSSLALTGCSIDLPADPSRSIVFDVGERYSVCALSFDRKVPASFEIARPDGTIEHPLQEDNDSFGSQIEIGAPLGTYQITARQGPTTLTASFAVEPPDSPTMVMLPPPAGQPGTFFSIGMAGFPAHQRVVLDLYRYLRGEGSTSVFEFLSSLGSADTDGRGEAEFEVRTLIDDPEGRYCVIPRDYDWEPTDATYICAGFTVLPG